MMNAGVDDGIYESWHHHEIHELLNESHVNKYIEV